MCLHDLVLVAPAEFPHPDAAARASGAADIVAQARVVGSLDEALAGCALVAGTSARRRGIGPPVLTPRECAERLTADSQRHDVAIVFGRERIGLTNEELGRCHMLVNIPANPDYASLNLAAAVQVLSYELMLARAITPIAPDQATPLATADDMERFYAHLEVAARETGFLDPENPKHLMRRLRRLFNRAQPDENEINILRGLLSALQGVRPNRRNT